jgi:glutathione S-transferase
MNARLFQFYPSALCAKIRKVLEFKGVTYDVAEVDYVNRAELLAATGQDKVPAIVFEDGEVVVDSDWIVTRLEALFPEPTLLPPATRGLHIVLTRYFESGVRDVLRSLAMPDLLEFYRSKGDQQLASFRLRQDKKFGAGFCDRAAAEAESNLQETIEALAPLDEALSDKAFLLGRMGLADFALHGQLWRLAFTGELKLPVSLPNLREFFGRMDRLSAQAEN